MTVFSLPSISPTALANPLAGSLGDTPNPQDGAANTPSFAQTLQNAFGQANALQLRAGDMAQDFARGKTSDVHSVMIASEQATMALQMTTQVRNKAVEAYQEIMRISM